MARCSGDDSLPDGIAACAGRRWTVEELRSRRPARPPAPLQAVGKTCWPSRHSSSPGAARLAALVIELGRSSIRSGGSSSNPPDEHCWRSSRPRARGAPGKSAVCLGLQGDQQLARGFAVPDTLGVGHGVQPVPTVRRSHGRVLPHQARPRQPRHRVRCLDGRVRPMLPAYQASTTTRGPPAPWHGRGGAWRRPLPCTVQEPSRRPCGAGLSGYTRFGSRTGGPRAKAPGMSQTKKRVGILISGRGSNMMALIDAARGRTTRPRSPRAVQPAGRAGAVKARATACRRAPSITRATAREKASSELEAALRAAEVDLVAAPDSCA